MGSLFVKQVGALCWVDEEIVLVSQDEGESWELPAATPSEGEQKTTVVEAQAWQKAGVLGHAEEHRLGEYLYSHGGKMYKVEVYELKAKKCRDQWPGEERCKRGFFSIEEAISKVDEFGLRDIFKKLKRRV